MIKDQFELTVPTQPELQKNQEGKKPIHDLSFLLSYEGDEIVASETSEENNNPLKERSNLKNSSQINCINDEKPQLEKEFHSELVSHKKILQNKQLISDKTVEDVTIFKQEKNKKEKDNAAIEGFNKIKKEHERIKQGHERIKQEHEIIKQGLERIKQEQEKLKQEQEKLKQDIVLVREESVDIQNTLNQMEQESKAFFRRINKEISQMRKQNQSIILLAMLNLRQD